MILRDLLAVFSDGEIISLRKRNKMFWKTTEYRATRATIITNEMWLDQPVITVFVRKFNSQNIDDTHPPFDDADLCIWVKG